jgi:linoleoyl-CoA desaturase
MYPTVKFSPKDPANFYRLLRKRVNGYFKENNIKKTGNAKMYVKTAIILMMFFVPYFVMLSQVFPDWVAILCYLVMGAGMASIGLSIMHDANHGAYSEKKWVNELMSYTINLVGGSAFTWRIQHNLMHHSYTNIYELDEDIEDKPFLRLSPYGKYRKYHRYQHIYAAFLYCLATVSWVLNKDFDQTLEYKKSGITEKQGYNHRREMSILIISKLVYWFYILALPIMLGVAWWAVVVGFLAMHFVAGLYITIVFQLAHVVEGPEHFKASQDEGNLENTWAIHQLKTTANFAPTNKLITWLVGGLNFQVEHHLFPNICHVHYKNLYKIVQQTAEECGLPYHIYPHFRQAVASHFRSLKALGQEPKPERELVRA